jgi:hypothetical protein
MSNTMSGWFNWVGRAAAAGREKKGVPWSQEEAQLSLVVGLRREGCICSASASHEALPLPLPPWIAERASSAVSLAGVRVCRSLYVGSIVVLPF